MNPNRLTIDEWMSEGERRFGPDKLKWKFVCPSCKHIQSPEDFRPFEHLGANADTAHYNCIGRYIPEFQNNEICSGKSPCNYTSGGLFCLSPWRVIVEGKEVKVFEFATGKDDV